VQIKITRKKRSVSIAFKAGRKKDEGVDLKTAVLAAVHGEKGPVTNELPVRIIEELAKLGYRGAMDDSGTANLQKEKVQ
jgi:hypothetical protein